MAVSHVTQVPYRRISGLESTSQSQIERNFESVVAQLVPTGVMLPWGGQNSLDVPSGWLLCDGAAYNRQAFSSLFAVIGVEFGAGDGSTSFNVPNMSDRFPRGTHTGGEVGDIGGSGDAVVVSHNHTQNSHGHSADDNVAGAQTTGSTEPPNHTHVGTTGTEDIGSIYTDSSDGSTTLTCFSGGCRWIGTSNFDGSSKHTHGFQTAGVANGIAHAHSVAGHDHNITVNGTTATNQAAGVSGTGANLPPYMDFRFIIKT